MNDKTNWKINFVLSEEINCRDLPSCNDVEFDVITNKANPKSITGFDIILNNITKDQVRQLATSKAQRVTDLFAYLSCIALKCKINGISEKKPSGGYTVSKILTIEYKIKNNIDITIFNQKLTDVLKGKDLKLNQQMEYFNKALNSITFGDPDSAIRNLFLMYDVKELPKDVEKYESLRHALSHDTVYPCNIENISNNFGKDYFKFTEKGHFDHSSENNKNHLTVEANNFLNQAKKEIKKIL